MDAVGTANSCGIQSQFVVGDGIVFRVAANDADLGGAALTSANVSSATLTVNGYATTIPLAYANHGGLGMWTGVLQTGTATGNYSPTGPIPYTITMKTVAVPAVTKKVTVVTHKRVKVAGKFVTRTYRTVKTRRRDPGGCRRHRDVQPEPHDVGPDVARGSRHLEVTSSKK